MSNAPPDSSPTLRARALSPLVKTLPKRPVPLSPLTNIRDDSNDSLHVHVDASTASTSLAPAPSPHLHVDGSSGTSASSAVSSTNSIALTPNPLMRGGAFELGTLNSYISAQPSTSTIGVVSPASAEAACSDEGSTVHTGDDANQNASPSSAQAPPLQLLLMDDIDDEDDEQELDVDAGEFSKRRFVSGKRDTTRDLDPHQMRRFLHPIGLWMKSAALESDFVASPSFIASFMSVPLVRVVHALIVIALFAFGAYQGVSKKNTALMWMSLSSGFVLFAAFVVTMSHWFRDSSARQYTLWLTLVASLVAVSSTLVITDNGVFSLTLFSTIVVGVFQGRFFPSFCVCLFDLAFYNIGRLWINDSAVSAPTLVMIDTLVACLICIGSFSAYQYERSIREAYLLQRKCQLEQERTQTILDNIFPPHVTAMLRDRAESSDVIAHAEPRVTVLFCDLQDFTGLMLQLHPAELVSMLNIVYSAFDVCSERHGTQKMETVGKTYMACAGLEGTREDHALACVEMALAMLELINSTSLVVRIGINSGAVISGVVGQTRPQYVLIGDVVNTASRHSSTGVNGRCSISQSTYQLIQMHRRKFVFESRIATMKGKGQVRTWLVSQAPAGDLSHCASEVDPNPADCDSHSDFGDSISDAIGDDIGDDIGEPTAPPVASRAGSLLAMAAMRDPSASLTQPRTSSLRSLNHAVQLSSSNSRGSDTSPLPTLSSLTDSQSTSTLAPPSRLSVIGKLTSVRSMRNFVRQYESGIESGRGLINAAEAEPVPTISPARLSLKSKSAFLTSATSSHETPLPSTSSASPATLQHSASITTRSSSLDAILTSAQPSAVAATPPALPGKLRRSSTVTSLQESSQVAALAFGDQMRPEVKAMLMQDAASEPFEPEVDTMRLLAFVDRRSRQPINELNEAFSTLELSKIRSVRFPLILAASGAAFEAGFDSWYSFDGNSAALALAFGIRFSVFVAGTLVLLIPLVLGSSSSEANSKTGADIARSNSIRGRGTSIWKAADYVVPRQFRTPTSSLRLSDNMCCAISDSHLHAIQVTYLLLAVFCMQAVTLANIGIMTTRSTLIQILYLTLLNNCGLSFKHVVFILPTLWLMWTAVAFGTAAGVGAPFSNSVPSSDTRFASEVAHGSVAVWSAWLALAVVANLVISLGRELYLRKGFWLMRRVGAEQQKSDELLYHMLPRYVARQLRGGQAVVAEQFDNLSLLYSDIKGFTEYSASSTPDRVVHLLSHMFTVFDRLNDQFNMYKVQTIGDAYVACGGLPFLRPGTVAEHAKNCVRMGLAMLREVSVVRTVEGGTVQMRLGMHVGSVVAGVVGTKKLRYDIWGVDALIANACESNGAPGCILLSEAMAALVADEFILEPAESFVIGGRVEPIKTFLLCPDRQPLQPQPQPQADEM